MDLTYWLGLVGLLVAATILTEVFVHQIVRSFGVSRINMRSLVRWVAVFGGLLVLAFLHLPFMQLVFVGLFAVSAGTDFETTYLPPDWYVYGCTALNIGVAYLSGVEAFRAVVVTQALCFGLAVFLAYLGAWAGGDVKLLMQYGAAAGSLPIAGVALVIEQLFRIGYLMLLYVVKLVTHRNSSVAWARTKSASIGPHGGVAFAGLILALAFAGRIQI